MRPVQIFICIVAIFHWSQATVWVDKVDTNIFDKRPRDFEHGVNTAMSKTKDFFSRDDVILGVSIGLVVALEYVPFLKKFIQIAPLFQNTIEDRSDWSASFTKAIANETSHAIADSEIRWMSTTMQTIQNKIKLLDENNPDEDNRKTVASIIHTDFDKMINFFDLKTSLFRKYPLMAGAPLLQLASLVSMFSPLANAIIPYEANSTKIACKMHDTLLAYRPLMVYARLRKLFTTENNFYSTLVNVTSLPYNPRGYKHHDYGLIDCDRDCNVNRPLQRGDEVDCLKDAFSTDDYYVSKYTSSDCKEDYAGLVRHRVEKLFPIDAVNKICVRGTPKPTGFGWLTIAFQNVFTYGKANGKLCKFQGIFDCDSYVQLLVNGEEVMRTNTEKNKISYDVDKIFTSAKIPKTATIKIEIWNSKSNAKEDKLILSSEGDVNSFLEQPLRTGAHFDQGDNRIETISFWQDEYE